MTTVEPETGTEATVEITVDGVAVDARPGEMLIAACERNGAYIPRFCYHPRMSPVGMCRMCLVEVDTGRGFALQTSCTVPVAEGMKVFTESEAAKKAQDGVLEFLLINHPLDCPVCDKGGECPLQDQTMAYGPGETRFVEEKRHFPKPIAISETVFLDRERCILCDRCTRFADEVAGDALIHFMGRGNHTEVNTFGDEPFASYFSGNTVQICPVGALTAAPYRFKARPWDLTESLSTAWVDSVGARIAVQASRNQVAAGAGRRRRRRQLGLAVGQGAFPGFEALNSDERLAAPMIRDVVGGDGREFRQAGWGEALAAVAAALAAASPERIAVLGGARLTNEAQYLWAKLAKGVIGHRQRRCPARRRPGPAARAGPAEGDDRRRLPRRRHGAADRPRPQRGAGHAVPAAAPRHRQRRRQAHRGDAVRHRPVAPGPRTPCARVPERRPDLWPNWWLRPPRSVCLRLKGRTRATMSSKRRRGACGSPTTE